MLVSADEPAGSCGRLGGRVGAADSGVGRRPASPPAMRGAGHVDLVVVVNGFPRLSETFVLHELLELERQGLRLHVVALRRPEEAVQQEALARLEADVEYLPDLANAEPKLALKVAHAALLLRRPRRYLNGVAEAIASPDYSRGDFRRALLLGHRLLRPGAPPPFVPLSHPPGSIARLCGPP